MAAVVLAAGLGRRFRAGADSKLLASIDGSSLVERVVAAALSSRAAPVVVVTGHTAKKVESVLSDFPIEFVRMSEPAASGLSGSLVAGVGALPSDASGVVILLADMPLVRSDTIDRLIEAFERAPSETDAVVPMFEGRSGNPVLLSRTMFPELCKLDGDRGARELLMQPHRKLVSCLVDDPGVEIDVDTQAALRQLQEPR